MTPWTVACQAPLSMEFSRQEYWSGLLFPPPGDLPDLGIKTESLELPALAGIFFYLWHHLGNLTGEVGRINYRRLRRPLSKHTSKVGLPWHGLSLPPNKKIHSQAGYWVQLSSVTQSCPTLCDPMNCSTPGLPVHHQLPESTPCPSSW